MKHLFIALFVLFLASCGTRSEQEEKVFEIHNGINISHWLSQSDKRGLERAEYFTRHDVAYFDDLGYDHIRIPVDEEQMFHEDGSKDTAAFRLLHDALGWCSDFEMPVVVDLHILRSHYFNAEFKPLFTDITAQERFYNCWRLISSELAKYPNHLVAYELMNEPVADDPEQWNIIVARCLEAVRELEPERTVIIGSNRWQSHETVKYLRIPENDKNIILSFHYYEPFLLTHYRASWTDVRDIPVPVHYPGMLMDDNDLAACTPEMKAKYEPRNRHYDLEVIESHFTQVIEFARQYGLKVYCGEYGCIHGAPEADKIRWYKDMTTLFEKHGIARANWDYKGSFGIIHDGWQQRDMINAILGK